MTEVEAAWAKVHAANMMDWLSVGVPSRGNRRETPGQYESYVDLVPDEWTTMLVEVQGAGAKLYVAGASQPCLVVHDLKRGPDAHGSVGLYVDNGTNGHFRNLRIRRL